jgi:hypothetical protein
MVSFLFPLPPEQDRAAALAEECQVVGLVEEYQRYTTPRGFGATFAPTRDSSPFGQLEHTLADDVVLHFTGPTGDGVLPRAQGAVEPARRVRDHVRWTVQQGRAQTPRW